MKICMTHTCFYLFTENLGRSFYARKVSYCFIYGFNKSKGVVILFQYIFEFDQLSFIYYTHDHISFGIAVGTGCAQARCTMMQFF